MSELLTSFIYDNPTWLWGSLFLLGTVFFVFFFLTIIRRTLKPNKELLHELHHNDTCVGLLLVVSTAYTMLLALLAFDTLEAVQSTKAIVQSEANYIGNIYRNAYGLSSAMAQPIQQSLLKYLHNVVEKEWPAQKNGTISLNENETKGWTLLDDIDAQILSPQVAAASTVIQADLLSQFDDLYAARQMRLLAAEEALPRVIWRILFLGGFILLILCAMLGSSNFRLKVFITTLTATSLMLIIILIIALDRPLRGDLGVDTSPYTIIEQNLQHSSKNLTLTHLEKST